MKHQIGDLYQLQSLPLEMKVARSKRLIRDWYDEFEGQVYVSLSGKDSAVLKHLVSNTSGVKDVPTVTIDTGLEYPEVRRFDAENADVIIKPAMRFDEVVEKYGYPVVSKETAQKIYEIRNTNSEVLKHNRLFGDKKGNGKLPKKYHYLIDAPFKISSTCCYVMKKAPAKKYEKMTGRKRMTGMMAYESRARLVNWAKHGCNAYDNKRPASAPLSFWTEQDVLQYIKETGIAIPDVYGEIIEENGEFKTTGVSRTGCMFCMFGCHIEDEPNRFQRMKVTHPKQYEYCMNNLGLEEVLNYMGVKH